MRIIKNLWGYISIIAIGTFLAILVNAKASNDYNVALETYRYNSLMNSNSIKVKIEQAFENIRNNLRTISFLPSVRNINRYGSNLDVNAHESIQQIYNNLKNSIAISEVYIVPVDLEPDQIDQNTKQPQVPILMFDQLIMNESDRKTESDNGIPQVEIYEYRALKMQMEWLKENYPTRSSIDKLNLPLISTKEVITCDNSQFITNRIDANRSGIVLSVPFYGPDDKLKGTITAVMLTNNILTILADSNYALINYGYDYTVMHPTGQAFNSRNYISASKTDPELLFSEILTLNINNPQSSWKLWAGYPNNLFLTTTSVKSIKEFQFISYTAIMILVISGCIALFFFLRSIALVKNNNEELEQKIEKRSKEIELLNKQQQNHQLDLENLKKQSTYAMANKLDELVNSLIIQIIDATTQIESNSQNALNIAQNTMQYTVIGSNSSSSSLERSLQISSAAKKLSSSIKDISIQMDHSGAIANEASRKAELAKQAIDVLYSKSEKVNQIITLISNISSKINLLALNATIESARAGEAGKGFAIVASEVKGLSSQVAKASEEITKQMEEIKSATKDSVEIVNDILIIIKQVLSTAQNISNSIKMQSTVTEDISQDISSSANSIKDISSNILSIKDGSEKTQNFAKDALRSVENLNKKTYILKDKILEFITAIKN